MRQLRYSIVAVAFAAATLTACGGSDDPGAATPAPQAQTPVAPDETGRVPASATGSVGALIAFMKSLVADDSSEPLGIGVVPPVDDTGEPMPLT